MTFIGQRIIAYLKADDTLINAAHLGSATNIFVMSGNLTKSKYVVVEAGVGEDGNNLPSTSGTIDVDIGVSKTIANAHSLCLSIVDRVDFLLNKGETGLSNGSFSIIHINRVSGSGLQFDDRTEEYWFSLTYSYILDES